MAFNFGAEIHDSYEKLLWLENVKVCYQPQLNWKENYKYFCVSASLVLSDQN